MNGTNNTSGDCRPDNSNSHDTIDLLRAVAVLIFCLCLFWVVPRWLINPPSWAEEMNSRKVDAPTDVWDGSIGDIFVYEYGIGEDPESWPDTF